MFSGPTQHGTMAVAFSGVVVAFFFIIGCTLAPSSFLDVDAVLSIAVESGTTYADAINEFTVFDAMSDV
jgi:hypothetical protein